MTVPIGAQVKSAGNSHHEIHAATLAAARPRPSLSWLDVGCGEGDVIRAVLRDHAPCSVVGIDIIDWIHDDLRDTVKLITGPAESVLAKVEPADRVLLIETLEHLEAPWTVLRAAAQAVRPGGWLVASTPNIASLRHRFELAARGTLTAFRESHEPHLSPILPHVTARVLREEGLIAEAPTFVLRDVIPKTRGRLWPTRLASRFPQLACTSVVVAARRPGS